MRKSNHILAIIIVLTVLIGGGVFALPKLAELQGKSEKDTTETADSSAVENIEELETAEEEPLTFEEKMQQDLQTLKTEYSRRHKRYIWTLGRGKTIIVYLLHAQRFVQKNGGQILRMEEIHDRTAFQTAQMDILKPDQDSLRLELQVSESIFRNDASMLALAFEVKTITPEMIVALNKLDFPYDLLIQPFGMSQGFFPDLDKVKNKELVLWISMESTKLDKSHNKLRPLRIHHTEEQIELVINDAKKLVPSAVGIVSRFGEQAVEHKQLLQAILNPAEKNKLWFIDATSNKLSKVPSVCKDLSIQCKSASPYNPDNSSLADYMKIKMRESTKKGLSVMIIPLTLDNIEKVSDLSTRAKNQGTSLVNLSTFMKY